MSAMVDFVARDVPRTLRRVFQAPAFSLVVIVTLALAIGANGAVFTLIDQLLLRPLPVHNPDTLVVVNAPPLPRNIRFSSSGNGIAPDGSMLWGMSYDQFVLLSRSIPVFERTLAHTSWRGNVLIGNTPSEAWGEMVTGGYFRMLGIVPAVGRLLGDDDDRPGASPVVVLAHGYWQRQFGGDPGALGRTIRIGGFPVTVVGIAAASFTGLDGARSTDFFVPLEMFDVLRRRSFQLRDAGLRTLTMIARLQPGTAIGQAQAAADVVYQNLLADAIGRVPPLTAKSRQFIDGFRLKLYPAGTVASQEAAVSPQLLLALRLLMAMAVLLLVISAANVTNLILAREVRRRRDVAIRFALGAGRARMLAGRLVESSVLALAAGGASLVVASWLADALLTMLPVAPQQASVTTTPDRRVLLFTAAVAVGSGLLVWLASALPATRRSSLPPLTDTADGGGRTGVLGLRRALLVLQAALSLALLCGASVLAHSLYNLTSVDPGFRTAGLTAFRIQPASAATSASDFGNVVHSVLAAVRTVPGVQAAAATTDLPLVGGRGGTYVAGGNVPADAPKAVLAAEASVTAGYFAGVGIPLVRGREFTGEDDAGASRVAMVNESLASALFGDQDPIGQMVGLQYQPLDRRIVGVVKDTRTGVRRPADPAMYVPWAQHPVPWAVVVVRTPRDGTLDLASARQTVARVDASMPVADFATLNDKAAATMARDRTLALLSSAIGALAALLCGLGLFALMNYRVATRTREIGVRVALGAGAGSIQWLVIREALTVMLVGAPIGLAAYLASSRVMASILFNLSPSDGVTLASAAAVLALVTVAAAWMPARRAMKLEPAVTLRRE